MPQNQPELDLGGAVRGLSGGQFVFNRYSLVKLIGRGRFSAVWQAWDDKQSRDVALKFLPESLRQSPEAVEALRGAVARAQAVKTPQVAKVFGLEEEDKLLAVAGELIEGQTLHALREQKKDKVFDAVELKEWFKQITKVLAALHAECKTCHGNLRPSNLYVTAKNEVILADAGVDATAGFWINKLEGSPKDVSQTLRYGSPQFAASGEATVLDDIYSLGAVTFELFTSRPPFNAGNILAQVKEDVPPSMTRRRRDMRIVGEPIPRAWDETVAACLAKDPEKRPATMDQVASQLELYGPAKVDKPTLDAQTAAAVAAAMAAAPKPDLSAAGVPGGLGTKPAKKNLIPLIAVGVGVLLGIVGFIISQQSSKTPTDLTFNPDGTTPRSKGGEIDPAELEKRLEVEREALRRKAEEESRRIEEEKKKLEQELEKRKAALAASIAAAEKARQEAEAKQRQAEEEAAKRAAEAEAKQKAAAAEAARLAAEREAIRKKEEELKAAQERALAAAATTKAEAEAERKRLEQELAQRKAAEEKLREAAEKARLEAESTKTAEAEAARKLAELEKAKQESEAKALAAAEAERKRRAEAEAERAELERKAAEAERRRRIEEATRLADMERAMKLAKLDDEARKKAEAERAATEKAKKEAEAKLLAAATIVGDKPEAGRIWHNSLGMRMVPVDNLFVCAWETRVQDFEAFERLAAFRASSAWKSPGFRQGPTHPVVNVSYDDALAFCNWLTQKEHKEGIIPTDQLYRLPTDAEWSHLVGLPSEAGATPEERSGKIRVLYPWGDQWPPPSSFGNYSDGVTYDRFDNTAPVASFAPNAAGLFDLGGNVWEWCMDWGDSAQKQRVLRGGAWFGYVPGTLMSSYRLLLPANERRYDNGFRVVLGK